jgi:hypothetical protein
MILRVWGACTLATTGATIGLLIVWRLNRRAEIAAAPQPTNFTATDMVCPCCGKRARVPAGKSSCTECGLLFELKFEEPRCVGCGYLLFRLKSSYCPECGIPVAAAVATSASSGGPKAPPPAPVPNS